MCVHFHPVRAYFGLQGGGVEAFGNVSLTNCNIYQNAATIMVCLFPKVPGTFFPCPLNLALFGLQGGAMAIHGTATLTNCNIYQNTAPVVSARLLES